LADLKSVTVLVAGHLHPQPSPAWARPSTWCAIERADPACWAAGLRRVRGLAAAMTRIDAAFIDALPNLEIIANFGVGYDAIDAPHAGKVGVMVTNTPDVLTEEVADTASRCCSTRCANSTGRRNGCGRGAGRRRDPIP
jgi:lactate dehydrogenase-like 2-hydroxyacid dehydrogenase